MDMGNPCRSWIWVLVDMSMDTIFGIHVLMYSWIQNPWIQPLIKLSHTCSHCSAQSTHALLCLGYWSKLNLVRNEDLNAAAKMPDVVDGEDFLGDRWNAL